MSLVAVKCPSCGGDLELDGEREYGFCQFCGTKVMLHDTVHVKHSGTVSIDESSKAANCLKLANQSYDLNKLHEAYQHYTKVLEYDGSNCTALFRRSLCAGWLAPPDGINCSEVVQGYSEAHRILDDRIAAKDPQLDLLVEQQADMTDELVAFALEMSKNALSVSNSAKFNEQDEGYFQLRRVDCATLLLTEINDVIPVEYEQKKKQLLDQTIILCDYLLTIRCQYISGYSVDKKGRKVPIFLRYVLPAEQISRLQSLRARAVTNFNNLPSNVNALSSIAGKLGNLQQERENLFSANQAAKKTYTDSVTAFWNANAEKFSAYKKAKNKSWFALLAGAIGLAVSIIVALIMDKPALILIGVALLALSIFIKVKLAASFATKFEAVTFPAEVKQKKGDWENATAKLVDKEKEIAHKQAEKQKFESTLKR